MKYILASASERRKQLLEILIPKFEVIVSEFDEESVMFSGSLSNFVMDIAFGKAKNVISICKNCDKNDSTVIACDTIVSVKNKILGKPHSREEARYMLKLLSGDVHEVYSGLIVHNTLNNVTYRDYEMTKVKFAKLSDAEIEKYLDTGEPFDKAGAYGIQGYGSVFVEKINGSYYNVVGLPLNKLYNIIRDMGVNL